MPASIYRVTADGEKNETIETIVRLCDHLNKAAISHLRKFTS